LTGNTVFSVGRLCKCAVFKDAVFTDILFIGNSDTLGNAEFSFCIRQNLDGKNREVGVDTTRKCRNFWAFCDFTGFNGQMSASFCAAICDYAISRRLNAVKITLVKLN